jgi:hypothetical protein
MHEPAGVKDSNGAVEEALPETNMSAQQTRDDERSREARRLEVLLRNRRHAANSRQRRMRYRAHLEQVCAQLEIENRELEEERRRLMQGMEEGHGISEYFMHMAGHIQSQNLVLQELLAARTRGGRGGGEVATPVSNESDRAVAVPAASSDDPPRSSASLRAWLDEKQASVAGMAKFEQAVQENDWGVKEFGQHATGSNAGQSRMMHGSRPPFPR